MNRLQRAALLTALADKLRDAGSWCGETHLQKAAYLLQTMLQVPLGFDFILYKHGPFSFDLRDELTALRADGLLELRPQPYPYGPSLLPTPASAGFRERYRQTLDRFGRHLDFIADKLGGKNVAELERLATACFVTQQAASPATPEERARSVNQLKPHVPLPDALAAVEEIDRISEGAREITGTAATGANATV